LGLHGTDGTEPTLDLSGVSTLDGEETEVKYQIDMDGTKHLTISPIVKKTTGDEYVMRRLASTR